MATPVKTTQRYLSDKAGGGASLLYIKQDALNSLAGTTGRTAQDAANIYAGTVGLSKQNALNAKVVATGLSTQEAASLL